jgi:hypothetical protein
MSVGKLAANRWLSHKEGIEMVTVEHGPMSYDDPEGLSYDKAMFHNGESLSFNIGGRYGGRLIIDNASAMEVFEGLAKAKRLDDTPTYKRMLSLLFGEILPEEDEAEAPKELEEAMAV